jgi:hypothetical protein
MANLMFQAGIGAGFLGSSWQDMCDVIGAGAVGGIVGKAFATVDVGTVPGVGKGTGTGIIGVVPAVLSASLFTAMSVLGPGTSLPDLCDAIANAMVGELGAASLSSNHAPVFAGAGMVTVGSIPVVGSVIGDSIKAAGIGKGFLGESWPTIAQVIGAQIAASILAGATGSVTIAPVSTSPPTSAGAGVGSGTLS